LRASVVLISSSGMKSTHLRRPGARFREEHAPRAVRG